MRLVNGGWSCHDGFMLGSAEILEQVVPSTSAKLVELVRDQLELAPDDRLRGLLEDRWPACGDALHAAALLGDRAVLVGPVAAALAGAPHRLTGRVDVLVDRDDRGDVDDQLFDLGAEPSDVRMAGPSFPDDRRTLWSVGAGTLSVRVARREVEQLEQLRDRAITTVIAGLGVVRVPHPADLLRISAGSPWSEEHVYTPSLSAILALSGTAGVAVT